jgi:hypothetical protein
LNIPTPQELKAKEDASIKHLEEEIRKGFYSWLDHQVLPDLTSEGYTGEIPDYLFNRKDIVSKWFNEKGWSCDFFMEETEGKSQGFFTFPAKKRFIVRISPFGVLLRSSHRW